MSAPRLRFMQFNSKWVTSTLEDMATFFNGERIPLSETERLKRKGIYRYFGASGVIDYIDDYLFDGQYILIAEDGANIITRSSPLVFIIEGKFWVNNHAHIFKSTQGNNIYLASYLERLDFKKYNSGTAQPKLNLENLKKILVTHPCIQEQTTIGNFFSTIDHKISLLQNKHKLLSQYKQGVMQKLFSGSLRFKDAKGQEFPKLKRRKLGNLCNIVTGKLDANAMVLDGKYRFYTCAKTHSFIDTYAFDAEALLISGNGAYVGYIHHYKGKFNAYQRTYVLLSFQEVVIYIKYYLEKHLKQRIWSEKKEGNTPYIVMSTLADMDILLPSREEQTQIAHFLSTLDAKLDKLANQIDMAKRWKQGLLQQMFV